MSQDWVVCVLGLKQKSRSRGSGQDPTIVGQGEVMGPDEDRVCGDHEEKCFGVGKVCFWTVLGRR